LLPGNENPGNSTAVTGGEIGAGITFDTVSKLLTINVGWGTGSGFTGSLTGHATAAHIHTSSGFGTNGGVVINLGAAPFTFNTSAASGSITGTSLALSGTQETQLFNNQLYINVHTVSNPGGEIRGNLVAVPEPSSMALLGVATAGLAWQRRRKIQT
jgi:hypothetical protein